MMRSPCRKLLRAYDLGLILMRIQFRKAKLLKLGVLDHRHRIVIQQGDNSRQMNYITFEVYIAIIIFLVDE